MKIILALVLAFFCTSLFPDWVRVFSLTVYLAYCLYQGWQAGLENQKGDDENL